MSRIDVSGETWSQGAIGASLDMDLEVVGMPVADVDRAKLYGDVASRSGADDATYGVFHLVHADTNRQLACDVIDGLTSSSKWLPSRLLYEDTGSKLFERITQLDEYYPTRAERAILAEHAGSIAVISGSSTVVELGSGDSDKTILLLDAFDQLDQLAPVLHAVI